MPKGLDIRVDRKDSQLLVITLVGRVDSETYMDLDKGLRPILEMGSKKVLFDMAKCDYVASAGIRVFFDFMKKLQMKGAVMSMGNLQPQIKKVFEIVKALPLESVFTSMEEADAYLERMMDEELKKKRE